MIDYKNELNPEQYQVVTEGDGPCLVLAGAGSGKTRTLVYRVAYLLEKGIKPENILLVTFTNKAAKEMMERVKQLIGFTPEQLNGGTFHRMGNKTLRTYADKLGFTRGFSILDRDDSQDVIKSVMNDLNINVKGQNFPKVNVLQSVISFANSTHTSVLEVAQEKHGFPDFVAFKIDEIAAGYKAKKKSSNTMDFDDLLIKWLELIKQFPEVKKELTEQYQYIMVDEYQDTNYIQASIVNELASHHSNILVVGDDAQSIYSFRAADVNNILNFPKTFPGAKEFRIETNYRSTPQILSLANESISHNSTQFSKKLKAVRDDGILPSVIPARDVYQQATMVAKRIKEIKERGGSYNDIAILFRATFHSAELQLELAKENIPYIVRGGKRYFEQAHIKDVVSYLKLLANFTDEIAWKRVLRLHEGIGQVSADKMWRQFSAFASLPELLEQDIKLTGARAKASWAKISSLLKYLVELKDSKPGFIAHAVSAILERGYEKHLQNTFDNYTDRLEDLTQFIDFVVNYKSLDQLLADITLSESFANVSEAESTSVVLSTIHQSKGLEWKYVMLISVRDGDFPHYKSFEDRSQLEEERRLFYVAVTRAKDELSMLYPVRKFSYQFGETKAGPSLFIKELDPSKYVEVHGAGYSDFSLDNESSYDGFEEETIYYD